MSRPRMTAGKRSVQQVKREKAKAKQERRGARAAAPEPSVELPKASEAELIEHLASIHGALEAGEISPQVFEEQRERIRLVLEEIERAGQGKAVVPGAVRGETHA